MLTSAPRTTMTSLYETLRNAGCSSQELPLSPSAFKSSINAIFALLIDRQISATIIAKLPREPIWYESLEQYRRSPRCASSIYLLKPQSRRSVYGDVQDISTQVSASATDTGLYAIEPQPSQMTDVWLPSNNLLRQDFFVIVISPQFQGLFLAHRRPKSKSSPSTAPALSLPSEAPLPDEQAAKATLLGLHSFEASWIGAGLEAVIEYVEALQPQSSPDAVSALEHWLRLSSQVPHFKPDMALLSALWAQQLAQQERLCQTNAALKPQAELGEQLQQENQRLGQALTLKNELSKRVGQELRAPLSSMKTALSILSTQNLKPAQRQRYVDMLTRECDRQSALISSILELIHLEEMSTSAPLEPLNLIDIVPGVVSTYQPLAQEQGIMLAYTVPDDLPPVACLSPWLKQIVINLLDNGIKFTPKNGQVWVKAYPQADRIQLEFQDTGIGIAPGDVDRVFERFYRGRPTADGETVGAGLGLSIVQQLLLKCGGMVSVESELGRGSTFHVSLSVYRS